MIYIHQPGKASSFTRLPNFLFEAPTFQPLSNEAKLLYAFTVLDEYENLCDKYLEKHRKGEGFNFFHFNIDLEGGVCLQKKVSACGAGNEYFSVVPNGDIYPCHQFAGDKDFLMGNVYEGRFNKNIREKFASSCLFTREGCGDCFAKFICSGGCAANNYHFEGDINKPYKTTCEMMKKRIECGMHVTAVKKGQK